MIIGITGGICSGKSTVVRIFKELGAYTIDADEIAHSLIKSNKSVRKEIIKYFGENVLDSNGEINRKKLAKIVFSDFKKRKKLEKILHPLIIKEIKRNLKKLKNKIVVLDLPLLFEANLCSLVDKIIVVYVPLKTQLERLRKRDKISLKEAREKIFSQIPLKEKKKIANFIIDNRNVISKTKKQVYSIWEVIKNEC